MKKIYGSILTVLLATSFSALMPLGAADTTDDKALQKSMKEIGDTAKRFKKNMEEKNAAAISKDATRIAAIYKETLPIWKNHKFDDATKWTEESVAAATATAAAAKAEDWDKVKSSWGGVMKNCKSCHETHREKVEDGVYKVK